MRSTPCTASTRRRTFTNRGSAFGGEDAASIKVDFAVFGPHGLRLLRKLTISSFAMNASGEWQRRELPGPPSYEGWFEIFRVFRTTFLLLGAASAERLDSYCEHIRSLHSRFGSECWGLIYMADVHMRSEQFERIRRRLEIAPEFGYTSASPWPVSSPSPISPRRRFLVRR